MHPTGLLSVWNHIAPAHEAEFNAWYEAEHLDERMTVPGFRSARRYRAVGETYAYAALYELDGPEVLQSPAYLDLLAHPTPRTRAIMPHFREMNRAACHVPFDSNPAIGAVRHLAILSPGQAPDLPLDGSDDVRIRVALPDPALTGGATPEQQLRASPDTVPAPFVIVESDDLDAVNAAARQLMKRLAAPAPRMFALISARGAGLSRHAQRSA